MKFKNLIINSNKWFSAVSDYSAQLALSFELCSPDEKPLVLAHDNSPLHKMMARFQVRSQTLPLLPSNVWNFILCLYLLSSLFRKHKNLSNIWVFEGREHSLCCVHRLFFPWMWKKKKLFRIRGQAQHIKKNYFSHLVYTRLTDHVVYAAHCLRNASPFAEEKNSHVLHYGKDISFPHAVNQSQFLNSKGWDCIQNSCLNSSVKYLLLGRFDPVKGHTFCLEGFSQAQFHSEKPITMMFLGRNENVTFDELVSFAKSLSFKCLTYIEEGDNQTILLANEVEKKQILISTLQVTSLDELMKIVDFGVITSQGSEVICRVAVEFMQARKPLLVSHVGALLEVTSPQFTLSFDPSDTKMLTLAFQKSSEWKFSGDKYKQASEAARLFGEKYSLNIYKELKNYL